ncbi:type II toxin-antitoxin system RelE/ParE family toxin [Methylobacterium sp. ID0610]|uniref:type II toxin-antitoxin system RelE/ParE family toxin n=1 Tax=Methylobacterium carpenticola TaxID=3344827 RepID=UPI00367CF545
MRDLVLHPIARADLFGLYDHIARQGGPARAGRDLSRIEAACNGLRDFPEMGTPRDDIAEGLRTHGLSSAGC